MDNSKKWLHLTIRSFRRCAIVRAMVRAPPNTRPRAHPASRGLAPHLGARMPGASRLLLPGCIRSTAAERRRLQEGRLPSGGAGRFDHGRTNLPADAPSCMQHWHVVS